MNVFDLHLGAWAGTNVVLDANDREIERFETQIVCTRDGDAWHQKTIRKGSDERSRESEYTGTFRTENELIYDHPNVQGRAVAMTDRDIVTAWVDADVPDVRFVSIITLVADNERVHTVQKIENDQLTARILIREHRT